ncbi:hypothetical protein D3C76_1633040 [compost metagenome]
MIGSRPRPIRKYTGLSYVAEALMAATSCGPSEGDTTARSAIERMVAMSSVAWCEVP